MTTWEETKSLIAEARDTGNFKKVNVVDSNGRGIYKRLYQYPSEITNILDCGEDGYGFVDPYELKRLGWVIKEGWR